MKWEIIAITSTSFLPPKFFVPIFIYILYINFISIAYGTKHPNVTTSIPSCINTYDRSINFTTT